MAKKFARVFFVECGGWRDTLYPSVKLATSPSSFSTRGLSRQLVGDLTQPIAMYSTEWLEGENPEEEVGHE